MFSNKVFNTYAKVAIGIIFCWLSFSCKKFVNIYPTNRVTSNVVFSDSNNATNAIVGIYIEAIQNPTSLNLFNGAITVATGLSGDELVPSGNDPYAQEFYRNAVSPDNPWIYSGVWQTGYKIIYSTNACIEGLQLANKLSPSLRNQLLGEAKFIRAFAYYLLINMYGDIPYIKSSKYQENVQMPRTNQAIVLSDIQLELEEAIALLSDKYFSPGKQRPNRATAQTLLAKVYLLQKKWEQVEQLTSSLISDSRYALVKDLNKVFMPGSSEVIWQLNSIQPGYETAEGFSFVPISSSQVPNYSISKSLLSEFEQADLRKEKWLGLNIISTNNVVDSFYYPSKYKIYQNSGTGTSSESYSIFRLADVYLMRAEARTNLGKIEGAGSSIADVNIIRNRAGLKDTMAISKLESFAIVTHEKRIELFAEWGNRWFDLKRTNSIDAVMEIVAVKKGTIWNKNWSVFPIPKTEILLNPKLKQNEDYPN